MHADLPSSIEAYYQEVGRAGRDGRPATATPLWHYADVKTREFLIDHVRADDARRSRVGITPEERERRKALEHAKLRRMVAYADTVGCLRATILRYFGDPAAREPVACAAPASAASGSARPTGSSCGKFSRARAPRPYGGRKIAAMLVGHTEGLPAELTRLSTTGLLHDCASRLIEQWIESSCAAGLFAMSADQYHTLTVTPFGRGVMTGRVEDVRISGILSTRRGNRPLIVPIVTELKKMRRDGPSADDVQKVKETEKEGLETAENIHDAFRKYFPADRYTTATLLPEKTSSLQ